jgi:hypothetical protein
VHAPVPRRKHSFAAILDSVNQPFPVPFIMGRKITLARFAILLFFDTLLSAAAP